MNQFVASVISFLRNTLRSAGMFLVSAWNRYRTLPLWQKIAIPVAVVLILIVGRSFLASAPAETANTLRTVTLESVGALSGSGARGASAIGSVRSVTEANLYAESTGAVKAVRTQVGASVPAGFIIAQFENSSESAAVLQAEGAYDAALAARSTTGVDATTEVKNSYRSAFIELDTALQNDVDTFFGSPTVYGPFLKISADFADKLSRQRDSIDSTMSLWENHMDAATSQSPEALLAEAEHAVNQVSVFLIELASAANKSGSGATSAQITALASARASVDGLLTTLSSVRNAYQAQLHAGSGISASDANVKSALGVLRAAQASFEKTVIRAPIAGTVNFLSIRQGDFVTSGTHVATVAQNNALEIVAYVSEDGRASLTTGSNVKVNGTYDGVVTSIAPALDPQIKQIEVHIGVTGKTDLVNGQSVRVTFSGQAVATPAAPAPTGPLLLPLSAVKLRAAERFIFTVDSDNMLVAQAVDVGDVRSDRIEILSALPPELLIVSDVRGLGEGEKVNVAGSVL